MGIKIDAEAMNQGLMEALYEECAILTNWVWEQSHSLAPPQVDRARMHKEVVKVGGVVIGRFYARGIQALITEWGSGSLADESNPAWDAYVNSKYWNESRQPGHPITGRPEGDYVNLDNVISYSSGKAENLNLERHLRPQEPQHWLEGIMIASRPYIYKRLAQMVRMFPFYRYIHSDGR